MKSFKSFINILIITALYMIIDLTLSGQTGTNVTRYTSADICSNPLP